jgi:exopolysaccharide production protein ExoY
MKLASDSEDQRSPGPSKGARCAAGDAPTAAGDGSTRRDHAAAEIEGVPTPIHQRRSKRALDIAGSLGALVVFSPIILLTALAVYLTDRGPVFFRQIRVGADGREFRMIKFRSMRPDAEEVLHADPILYQRYLENNCKLEAHEDLRITKVGRFIRATSLDEFPQFWNVLKGDMSLVGPRPVLPWELEEKYGWLRGHYIAARPGITGPWQVSGRSAVGYDERVTLDTTYIEDWKLSRDISILVRTPLVVMARDGAY